MELGDVGKDVLLTFDDLIRHQTEKNILMIIKAPKGTIALFDNKYISPDTQCEAIKAFMEEHKND